MRRRGFLAAGAGLALGGLAAGPLLRLFLRKNGLEHYEIRRDCCFPVVRSDHAAGFIATLNLQGVSFTADPLRVTGEAPNFAAVVFFDENGTALWQDVFELSGLTSEAVTLPDLRAAGTLWIAMATSPKAVVDPQTEVGAYLRQQSPTGRDGHHSIGCPVPGDNGISRSVHLVPAPLGDESVIIGFSNPADHAIRGRVRLRDDRGVVIFDEPAAWPPHATRYLSLGRARTDVLPCLWHLRMPPESRAVLAYAESEEGSVSHASWMMSPEGFAMSHGFTFGPKVKINAPLPLTDAKGFLARGELAEFQDRGDSMHWMMADFIPSGEGTPLGPASWSTQILVPNLTDEPVTVTMSRFDERGRSFGAVREITAPARGIAVTEYHGDEGVEVPSMICHPGQGNWPNTLSKIVARSGNGRFFVQHFRPAELSVSPALEAAKRRTISGWQSDYWISGFDESVSSSFLRIRNFSGLSTGRLILQKILATGVGGEIVLDELRAGEARTLPLKSLPGAAGTFAVRVLSEKAPVKVAALSGDLQGRPFALHGTQRVAWLFRR